MRKPKVIWTAGWRLEYEIIYVFSEVQHAWKKRLHQAGGLVFLTAGQAARALTQFQKPGVEVEDVRLKKLLASIRPFETEDYQRRWQRAWQLMVENRLGGLFVEPGPTMQYFTGSKLVAQRENLRLFAVS